MHHIGFASRSSCLRSHLACRSQPENVSALHGRALSAAAAQMQRWGVRYGAIGLHAAQPGSLHTSWEETDGAGGARVMCAPADARRAACEGGRSRRSVARGGTCKRRGYVKLARRWDPAQGPPRAKRAAHGRSALCCTATGPQTGTSMGKALLLRLLSGYQRQVEAAHSGVSEKGGGNGEV